MDTMDFPRSLITALALSIGMTTAASAAGPIETLYDGNGSPAAQGWSAGGGGTQLPSEGITQFMTANDTNRTSQFQYFQHATGATDYIASIRLLVVSSSYNSMDAALTFNPFNVLLTPASRANTFMIGNDVVVWGDLQGASHTLDTNIFHDYAFRYNGGKLDLYIDASFADIASGTASPVLSRTLTDPVFGTLSGGITWGDATNDFGYDSNYLVDNVKFQDLGVSPVPEPSTYAMMGLGLAGLLLGSRRRGGRAS